MKRNTKCNTKNIMGRHELMLLTVLKEILKTEESSE